MTVRRRVWWYRMPGENFARSVTFAQPVPTCHAKQQIAKRYSPTAELYMKEPR